MKEQTPTFIKLAEYLNKQEPFLEGLSYDDVIIQPGYSEIQTLDEVSTSTELITGIPLTIPIVSANMTSVTEYPMAEFMARVGGIGIIHRAMTIEEEANQVKAVKNAITHVVENPPVLSPEATLAEAREIMEQIKRGFVLVCSGNNLLGILTNRDIHPIMPPETKISDCMTPRNKMIVADPETSLLEAGAIMYKNRIEKLPLVDRQGNVGGVITNYDLRKIAESPEATTDKKGRLRVGAAVGIHDEAIERARELINAGADVIVVDVLHGDSKRVMKMVEKISQISTDVPVIAGNVATPEAARRLIDAGAKAVKVGYGPGAMCTTQKTTGTGASQFSAVVRCAAEAAKDNIPIIADGGIKQGGDLVKALAGGADTGMIGTALAGTDQSPGEVIIDDTTGDMFKISDGMATEKIQEKLAAVRGSKPKNRVAQGISTRVAYEGSAERLINNWINGLISGIGNAGARNIKELQEKVVFERQTPAASSEGAPHVLRSTKNR